jgi:Flp pilus assembly protein TadG
MRRLTTLARDTRGATIVEFAFVAPVMCVLLMGLCDLAYQVYAQSIVNGVVQKAGRDSTVQGANDSASTAAIDAKAAASLRVISKTLVNDCSGNASTVATYCVTRKNYDQFSDVRAEPFTDTNGNGIRDPGECYTDINGNNAWDADPGTDGQGGANDVTLYTMTVNYPRLFPVAGLLGWTKTNTITASTLLKNQPYATQSVVTAKQVCT